MYLIKLDMEFAKFDMLEGKTTLVGWDKQEVRINLDSIDFVKTHEDYKGTWMIAHSNGFYHLVSEKTKDLILAKIDRRIEGHARSMWSEEYTSQST